MSKNSGGTGLCQRPLLRRSSAASWRTGVSLLRTCLQSSQKVAFKECTLYD